MLMKNFYSFLFYILYELLNQWRFVFWWCFGIIALNLIRVSIWEAGNIIDAIFYSVMAGLSLIFWFVLIAVFMSVYYLFWSHALRAEMQLRTFSPSQAAERYFGTGGRPR